jgi:catechol 2,3-dioxygenase-like lactoylglutathione lyase family enzyme
MLADREVTTTLPVKDMEQARTFYEDVLGLTPVDDSEPNVVTYSTGKSHILVYESQFAGSNKGTAATWGVGDEIERDVKDLKAKGVIFEHYDVPGALRQGDIHVMGDLKAAWFKDPDGNIHSIINR